MKPQEEGVQAASVAADQEAQTEVGAETGANEGEGLGDLAAELEEARREAQEHYDKLLRLAAEFENYKKRIAREQEAARKYAEEALLRELLPTLDNLERALEEGGKSEDAGALLEGVRMTQNGLLATLKKFGVEPLTSVGEPFDPNLHEALTMEASDEVAANHVLREFQRGYRYKDRLLRAAKVVVSSGPAGDGQG